jgi:DNA-binding response OmpR family regulator
LRFASAEDFPLEKIAMTRTDRRYHILIVDDEPNVRLVFRTTLESAGYEVAEVEDGDTAIAALETAPADVVLLDLQMPRIGGMEVLRRLRESGNDVPVVIVTAHGSIPDAVEAMRLGAIDFLAKPLSPERLRRVVAEVIRRHSESVTQPESEPEAAGLPQPELTGQTSSTVVTLAPPAIELSAIKLALNRREFDKALNGLEFVLEIAPGCAEAHTLMGVLRETLGQQHAAYHAYRLALEADPGYGPALENMTRYCARFGLDIHNPSINPAAKP